MYENLRGCAHGGHCVGMREPEESVSWHLEGHLQAKTEDLLVSNKLWVELQNGIGWLISEPHASAPSGSYRDCVSRFFYLFNSQGT